MSLGRKLWIKPLVSPLDHHKYLENSEFKTERIGLDSQRGSLCIKPTLKMIRRSLSVSFQLFVSTVRAASLPVSSSINFSVPPLKAHTLICTLISHFPYSLSLSLFPQSFLFPFGLTANEHTQPASWYISISQSKNTQCYCVFSSSFTLSIYVCLYLSRLPWYWSVC